MTSSTLDTPTATDRYPGPCPQDGAPQALIAYALRWGLDTCDGAQLRRLDAVAMAAVRALPKDLTPTDHTLDRTLHDLRLRIATEQTRRAEQWARIAAQLAGLETNSDGDHDIPDQDTPEETDQDRAVKLLRAALTLIMGPQGGNGGGRPARLQPPSPTRPTPRGALDPSRPSAGNLPPKDGIQF